MLQEERTMHSGTFLTMGCGQAVSGTYGFSGNDQDGEAAVRSSETWRGQQAMSSATGSGAEGKGGWSMCGWEGLWPDKWLDA